MGSDRNRVHLIGPEGTETLPEMSKDAVAAVLVARFAALFSRMTAK